MVGGNEKGNWETGGCKIDRARGGTNISGHAPLLEEFCGERVIGRIN